MGLIVLTIAGIPIVLRMLSARTDAQPRPTNDTATPRNPYHCVSIRYRENACQAAKKLTGKRFLSKDAPALPLFGCDAATCFCRYAHYSDRRTGEDRRAPLKGEHNTGSERRAGRDRRQRTVS